ncbi:hypothetical protein FRZ67_21115 [Panacibacter ginsenosidivorans]|uniref:Uncharacterized protein n=1 Tax=Panacibacter ginsenosidivorans TaxID=1813871 RepID=A0A5B8VDU7_9BACT|nr:choice-of-anchor X domain-containing protein [Panacibacter ginsenosidivorans]QEC69677.1 hypothetical protein FRZ67_21115 [Panacibacter ginsenosidivorans]
MRTSKKILYLNLAAIFIFFFVSWTRNSNSPNSAISHETVYDYFFSPPTDDLNSFQGDDNTDEFDWAYNTTKPKKVPPADDVMVQRIPGDNNHLLVMAVYSYAAYHENFVTINYGGEDISLRDDGSGDDKVAGDGVYTTKIFTDVKEFRKLAIEMLKETIKNKWQPLFVDREFKASTLCDVNPFSETKFDNNEPVSIVNLTTAGETVQIGKVRQNSIFLTDVSVVEDPARTWNFCTQTGNINGAWTFKTLMKNLATQIPSQPASDQAVSDFVKSWLNSWARQKIINSDTVPARKLVNEKILNPWLDKSKAAGNVDGFLDMRFAPFKLTAIVNRFDLRERASGIPAGEGRMIFCLINSDCSKAEDFTLIFEYGINKPDVCDSLRNWATQWYNLKDLTLGSPEYLTALQKITDQFTLCGTNPNKTNQSCIDAVRTNEVALASSDATHPPRWEFREFGLNPHSHALVQKTVSQAPADKYNVQIDNTDVERMVKFINENDSLIDVENYNVPDVYDSFPFLAGKSTILDTPIGLPTKPYHWDGVENNKTAAFIKSTTTRHVFSRNVCSGCHAGEVQTFFTHVDPVFFGTQATLSGFLTGKAGRGGAIDSDGDSTNDVFKVKDAANRGTTTQDRFHTFSDIKRRAMDLKQVATTACATVFSLRNNLMFHPVGAVH